MPCIPILLLVVLIETVLVATANAVHHGITTPHHEGSFLRASTSRGSNTAAMRTVAGHRQLLASGTELGGDEATTVLSCNRDTVTIRLSGDNDDEEAFAVGSTFTYIDMDSALCSACHPRVRKVLAVEQGDDDSTLILRTIFATFGDVLEESGFMPGGGTVDNVAVEPIFDCPQSVQETTIYVHGQQRSRERRRRARDLQSSVPDSCGAMSDVDASGECVYTDCYVASSDSNGRNTDCYSCGSGCDNGCGSDAIQGITDFGFYSFAKPCCIHDFCYSTHFSQTECDDAFYGDMLDKCPCCSVGGVAKATAACAAGICCPSMALLYYGLVVGFGSGAYDDAQSDQQAHESSVTCIDCNLQLSGVPSSQQVECDAVPEAASPSATSLCTGSPGITLSESLLPGLCPQSRRLTRIWTATDDKGSTSAAQVITIVDTTAPIITGLVTDMTSECDSVPALPTPGATDNCDTAVTPVYTGQVRSAGTCEFDFTLTRSKYNRARV